MKVLITNWILGWVKNNWETFLQKFFTSENFATYLAKVMQWLLEKAKESKNYASVRTAATRIMEQCTLLLDVTSDGVVTSEEGGKLIDNANTLLGEWFKKSDYSVTDTLRESIANTVNKLTSESK